MSLVAQLKHYPFIMSISRIEKNFPLETINEYHQKLSEETGLNSVLIGNVSQAIVVMITLPEKFGILQWANMQEIIKTIHRTLHAEYRNATGEQKIVNFNILVTHRQSTVGVGFGKPRESDRNNEVFYPYTEDCENHDNGLQDAFNFIYNELCLSV